MPKHRRRSRRFRPQPPETAGQNTTAHAPPDDLSVFRARLKSGDLDGIVGGRLRRALRDVAADTSLDIEIGALRLALVRLLKEEPDASRLAVAVARIAAVAIQTSRVRQNPDSEFDKIQVFLAREIAAIEAENAQARAQREESAGASNNHAVPSAINW
jgi:hypothetical protein